MGEKVRVRIIKQDLISQFGTTPIVPYNWAMARIKKGHAVLYQPVQKDVSPPPKKQIVSTATDPGTTVQSKQPDIVWVQDNNFMGGAELSSQHVINVGKELGFDIGMITPQSFNIAVLRRAKLIVLNNMFTFNPSQFAEINRTIFEFQVPYVKYEHDMRELYDDRLSFSRRLFANSKMNVFISPLQNSKYHDIIYDMGYTVTLPLAIDTSEFYPSPKIKRIKNKAVHTSSNLHNKGAATLLSMVKAHNELSFDIYPGENDYILQMISEILNVTLKPRVSHDKMSDIYNEAEYLVHVPTGVWAGERVVLEAALCGCKLIINDNVGHKSWGWDFTDTESLRATLNDAPYAFWREIEGVM